MSFNKKNKILSFLIFIIFFFEVFSLLAQQSLPNNLHPLKITHSVKLDGNLNDAVWFYQKDASEIIT